MISLLKDKKIQEYDILTIQKSWRNFIVFTFYNFSRSNYYLAYNTEKKTKVYFYISKRLNTNKWNVTFLSIDIVTLKLKITENEIEKKNWIHNVYNFSSTFYSLTNSVNILSTIEKWVNEIETKHILLKNFNVHYSVNNIHCEANHGN